VAKKLNNGKTSYTPADLKRINILNPGEKNISCISWLNNKL